MKLSVHPLVVAVALGLLPPSVLSGLEPSSEPLVPCIDCDASPAPVDGPSQSALTVQARKTPPKG